MATSYNCTQEISILVCFAGKNRRVILPKNKCKVDKENGTFEYVGLYNADNDHTYKVVAVGDKNCANVNIYNRGGKTLIAERKNVSVRFAKKLFV